jgi:hypothetical protein
MFEDLLRAIQEYISENPDATRFGASTSDNACNTDREIEIMCQHITSEIEIDGWDVSVTVREPPTKEQIELYKEQAIVDFPDNVAKQQEMVDNQCKPFTVFDICGIKM